mgnify:CR=1 FL=1
MYDLNSDNPNPVVNYDGIQKNVTSVGFHEEGKWMYTGGEDNTVRIWDLRLPLHPLHVLTIYLLITNTKHLVVKKDMYDSDIM